MPSSVFGLLGRCLGALGFVSIVLWGSSADAQPAARGSAEVLVIEGRAQLAACLPAARGTLSAALRAAAAEFGARSAEHAFVAADLAAAMRQAGAAQAAIAIAAEAARTIAATHGSESLDHAVLLGGLAAAQADAGQLPAAKIALDAAIEIARRAAPGSPRLGDLLALRQDVAARADQPEAALAAAEEALKLAPSDEADAARVRLARAQAAAGLAEDAARSLAEVSPEARSGANWLSAAANVAAAQLRLEEALDLLVRAEAATPVNTVCGARQATALAAQRGNVHILRREGVEARTAFARALALRDRAGAGDAAQLAGVFHGLAVAERLLGDAIESDRLFLRATQLYAALGPAGAAGAARTASERAMMLAQAGQGARATRVAREGLAAVEAQAAPTLRDVANAHAALGHALLAEGRSIEARESFVAAVRAFERASGGDTLDVAPGLVEIGQIDLARGDVRAASESFARALAIQSAQGAQTGLGAARTRSLLAMAHLEEGRGDEALKESAEAVGALLSRATVGAGSAGFGAELRVARQVLERRLEVLAAVGGPRAADDAFEAAQFAVATRAGRAFFEMSERQTADPAAARLLRTRQELAIALEADEASVTGGEMGASARAAGWRAERAARRSDIARALEETDAALAQRGFDAGFAATQPASLAAVRAALRPDEALVSFVLGAERSWAVAVTREAVRFAALPIDAAAAADQVRRVRSALDLTRWVDADTPRPFQTDAAHDLFVATLGPVWALVGDKRRLVIVPDQALAALPFGVLLTHQAAAPRTPDDYRRLPWLASGDRVIAVAPSAQSVLLLRTVVRDSAAQTAFLGVGDPRLGPAAPLARRGITARVKADAGAAPAQGLLALSSLPETAVELTALARSLGAGRDSLLLGAEATERALKARRLDDARIIAFATHGMLAGELPGFMEPGLALTPPSRRNGADDGYLSASEIARLRLDADLVILSACNTGGGDGAPDGEGLSGLARAFFFAGARSLLVTHWQVDSQASLRFTKDVVRRMAAGAPRAEAVAEAQVAMRAAGAVDRWSAHPALWASFSYVGV